MLSYYGQMVEFGKPEHVITVTEAQQILGVSNYNNLKNLLRKAYGYTRLNDVLQGMGLPYIKSKRNDY